ncbi:MAG TPA: right-handed parallel beta-helix repeat-containing protein [Solirubrobacterales bacterium]|nr:right-handed parallel beta-helix repeat-containing protein [Solirubrobacterales bacterium]
MPRRKRVAVRTVMSVSAMALAVLTFTPGIAGASVLPTTISENLTLTASGSPYTGSTTIASGATVVAEPGVLVKSGTITVNGTLKTNGTAEQPVVFTSAMDTAAGQWTGIKLQAGSGASRLSHVEIRYAKTAVAATAAVSPVIEDSFIHHNSERGISFSSGGAPEIARNLVADNGNSGISFTFTGNGNQLNIHDNLVDGNKSGGIRVSPFSTATLGHVDFSGNEVTDNLGSPAIDFQAPTLPPDIDENFLSGNQKNGIWVSGTVDQSTTWQDRGYPFVSTWSAITVEAGDTLTLDPGTTIKGDGRGMNVNGSLVADGTATEPITFTSLTDDSVDGDTNGDGSATVPVPGGWTGLVFPSVNNVELSYLAFHYAKVAIDIEYLDTITVRNSDFINNVAALEVAQTAENNPALGALPCVPPYLSWLVSVNNWFGQTGVPTPSVDVASVIGAKIPEEYESMFGAFSSLASLSAPLYPGTDTIPFYIYSCPPAGIPPTPITPVSLMGIPFEPWFTDL